MGGNILQPVIRSVLAPVLRGPFDQKLVNRFSPASLFAAGEQGAWYDPSDLSTLFQDAAGTIPVTASGQPVGRMLDKSGRGNHATQATATARPIYTEAGGLRYLAFAGVDDFMVTGAVNFTATDKMTSWAGVRKLSDAARSMLFEMGNSSAGAVRMEAPNSVGVGNYLFASGGTNIGAGIATMNGYAAPISNVLSGTSDIASDVAILRINGAQVGSGVADQGAGNYGNLPIYIGARNGASLFLNGNLYGLILRGVTSTAAQVQQTEAYLGVKTGVSW